MIEPLCTNHLPFSDVSENVAFRGVATCLPALVSQSLRAHIHLCRSSASTHVFFFSDAKSDVAFSGSLLQLSNYVENLILHSQQLIASYRTSLHGRHH